MPEFFADNASAIFALAGALGGGVLSFVAAWTLKKRDLQLRLFEKVTDRRLASHDAIIALSKELRKTGIPYSGATSVEQRGPICLCTLEDFDRFNTTFALTMVEHTTWLSSKLVRELHLFQDYLANVQIRIHEIGQDKTFELGCLIREDFISFSSRIEQLAFDYFMTLDKLAPITRPKAPYYPREERESKLEATNLYSRHQEIAALGGAR